MWPFTKRARTDGQERDLLLTDVDLAPFAPFTEVDRYLLVYPVAVGVNYVLVVVYEAGGGQRVHAAHSPGITPMGAGMVNFVEWIATGIRRRDPRAIAMLTSWPTDCGEPSSFPDILTRNYFARRTGGTATRAATVLVNDDGSVENVFTRVDDCAYEGAAFTPRLAPGLWSQLLGTEVRRFSIAEWEQAADEIDPKRTVRDEADRESAHNHAAQRAWLKEMGID